MTLLQSCMLCVFLLCSYSVSPSWLGSWPCPQSSHIPCQILYNVYFYFRLTILVTPCFFCVLHSFPWRLDVLSYAYFDALLKSQYDLEFLCMCLHPCQSEYSWEHCLGSILVWQAQGWHHTPWTFAMLRKNSVGSTRAEGWGEKSRAGNKMLTWAAVLLHSLLVSSF